MLKLRCMMIGDEAMKGEVSALEGKLCEVVLSRKILR